jgi:hypothetical protein
LNLRLERFDADLASTDLVSAVDLTLESLELWVSKLLVGVDSSDPETETVGKELASSSGTSALDEWSGSEVLEARAWAGHVLSATLSTLGGVSEEGVTHPHGVVAGWAVWDLSGLGVNSDNGAWSLANVASRDVSADVSSLNGHHWNWSVGGQPVRLGVSAGVSADFVGTAEGSWESAELSRARASATQVLGVVVVVTDGVKEGVTGPKWEGASWATWVLVGLRVSREDDTDSLWASLVTWHTWIAVETVGTWKA